VDSDKFSPLSRDLNPILFPIAGTRILTYTLEFLERGGVEDVILICSRQTAQLQAYLASTKWGERGSPVKVRLVTAAAAHSTGDALREVDRLGLVKGDFVLIRGGILSNLPLQFMVEEHRRRKEDDKDSLLMTIVLMQNDTHTAFSTKRYVLSLVIVGIDDVGICEKHGYMSWTRAMQLRQGTTTSIDVWCRNISPSILTDPSLCSFPKRLPRIILM